MYAIEFPVEIDASQQIHVQLPKHIHASKARVIVMYEEESTPIHAICHAWPVRWKNDDD